MILERNEITDIYDLVLKNRTHEYQMRYNNLPNEPEKWTWIDREVPRIIAVQEFEKYVEKYNIKPQKMLSFNACQGAAQDPLSLTFCWHIFLIIFKNISTFAQGFYIYSCYFFIHINNTIITSLFASLILHHCTNPFC